MFSGAALGKISSLCPARHVFRYAVSHYFRSSPSLFGAPSLGAMGRCPQSPTP